MPPKFAAGGVDVRAVTAWSLLGTYDWNCLVTRINGHYESGVFDLRSPQPRPGDRPNATMSRGWTRAEPSSPRCTRVVATTGTAIIPASQLLPK